MLRINLVLMSLAIAEVCACRMLLVAICHIVSQWPPAFAGSWSLTFLTSCPFTLHIGYVAWWMNFTHLNPSLFVFMFFLLWESLGYIVNPLIIIISLCFPSLGPNSCLADLRDVDWRGTRMVTGAGVQWTHWAKPWPFMAIYCWDLW